MTRTHGLFVPAALLLAAVLAWFTAQAWHLRDVREELRARLATHAAPLQRAEQSRRTIDAFASQVQALADGGNVPVQMVLGEFRRRGIPLDAMTPALPPPASASR